MAGISISELSPVACELHRIGYPEDMLTTGESIATSVLTGVAVHHGASAGFVGVFRL
jgi:hypothetical protein